MKKLILASASPRRRELLKQIGLEFEIIPSNVDEELQIADPEELVRELALTKALEVAKGVEGVVIGADTIVVDGQTILGKPASAEEAVQMLKSLSGRPHQVMTGVAIVDTTTDQQWVALEITQVHFRDLSDQEIQNYVASGEPMDKAGSYAIQEKGALFVQRIEGCFFNVVGLPLLKTVQLLQNTGMAILENIK